jgi:hypothetical protein
MKEVHVCLRNCDGSLFIAPERNLDNYSSDINPRVENERETQILTEFHNADFIRVNDELLMAETEHFNFRRYAEDLQEEIVWIDEKI